MADDVKVTDRFSLKGKNFLITGGARGIGFAVAKAVAQLGGGVAILDFLQAPVDEFHTLSKKYGIKASYHRCDVTKQDSLESAFAEAVGQMGQLHGGLAAAGICLDEKLTEADWNNSQKILEVNILGTFWTAKLLAKHLIETKTAGTIVFIASLSGHGVHIPVLAATIYNASKAAVKGMVGPLAVELGPHNIRVNSISPGAILSPMTQGVQQENPAILKFFEDAAPVGRIGQPEDLTPMVCYLLSDASGFTTGADHVIAGGIHAGRCDHIRKSTAVADFMTTQTPYYNGL